MGNFIVFISGREVAGDVRVRRLSFLLSILGTTAPGTKHLQPPHFPRVCLIGKKE